MVNTVSPSAREKRKGGKQEVVKKQGKGPNPL